MDQTPDTIEIHCEQLAVDGKTVYCDIARQTIFVPIEFDNRYDLTNFCAAYRDAGAIPRGLPRVIDRVSSRMATFVLPERGEQVERLAGSMAALLAYQIELIAYSAYIETCPDDLSGPNGPQAVVQLGGSEGG